MRLAALQVELLLRNLLHHVQLNFAVDVHWERFDKLDVSRDLELTDVANTERLELFLCHRLVRLQFDPGCHLLGESLVRHAKDVNLRNLGIRAQIGLHLGRIDVGAASNDDVLATALEVEVALGVH